MHAKIENNGVSQHVHSPNGGENSRWRRHVHDFYKTGPVATFDLEFPH